MSSGYSCPCTPMPWPVRCRMHSPNPAFSITAWAAASIAATGLPATAAAAPASLADREGFALARRDDGDRPFPGLHVDVKIGRPLEEIATQERQRIERVRVHHPAHEAAAVVEGGASEERHGKAFQSARRA